MIKSFLRVLPLISVIILSIQSISYGSLDDLEIWGDCTITSGESYRQVSIWDDLNTTTVEFYGTADHFITNNSSTLNIYDGGSFNDGGFGYNTLLDSSTVNLYDGGYIGTTSFTCVDLYNSSTLNVFGGEIHTFVFASDSSIINFYDGLLNYEFMLNDSSEMHLYGGYIDAAMGANSTLDPTAKLYIYGTGFQYDPQAVWSGYAWVSKLTGTNLDGVAVTYMGIPDPAANPNIIFVPEPCSLLLFVLSAVILRNKNL